MSNSSRISLPPLDENIDRSIIVLVQSSLSDLVGWWVGPAVLAAGRGRGHIIVSPVSALFTLFPLSSISISCHLPFSKR